MRYFLLLIGLLLGLSVSAQTSIVDELQKNRVGQGTVTIHQDAKISALLGSVYVKNEDEDVVENDVKHTHQGIKQAGYFDVSAASEAAGCQGVDLEDGKSQGYDGEIF